MEKFRGKYRIESNRLPGWDYSRNGYYFLTIVAYQHQCIFGDIKNKKMVLSDFGKIVNKEWQDSFKIRNELFLDEFILMPNHIHAIVVLNNPNNRNGDFNMDIGGMLETNGRSSQLSQPNSKQSIPPQKPRSISSFVGGFKSRAITKIDDFIDFHQLDIAKYNRKNPLWQADYHDHIIRNKVSYWKIKNYIIDNPTNWDKDSLR